MNKLAIIVPFYKRPELTKLCFKQLRDQSKRLNIDVIVCGSEGEESKKLSKGFKYIECENILGAKLNALINECKGYDGVILLGSDDFISDSVIKMYQQIDTTKAVYYSFNDVYVYSYRLKKVVSDLEYTRVGNGIGVGRMFTKPTLEKCKYKLWDSKKLRGMDRNAQRTLRGRAIPEELIDLGKHFVIDIKLMYNLTAQDIVYTAHKDHELTIISEKLGKIGKEILNLKPTEIEYIKKVDIMGQPIERIKGKVIKAFEPFEEGRIYEFKKHNFKALVKGGFIEAVKEQKQPVTKKAAPKKKVVKKAK